MYQPKHFRLEEKEKVRELIDENSFATLLSYPANEKSFINHLPVIFSPFAKEENILIGHMAKMNPQWKHFKDQPEATLIFNGPHTYITPLWYKSGRDVPTWNYAVVHLQGRIELVPGFNQQVDILKALTEFFERSKPQPWEFDLPDDLLDAEALTSAIISFKFHIDKIESKFKLSQNRSLEDRQGIIEGLRERDDDMSKAVQKMMLDQERK